MSSVKTIEERCRKFLSMIMNHAGNGIMKLEGVYLESK